jgi:hypothetical protein
VTASIPGGTAGQINAAIALAPGRNNAQGVYVADPIPPPPFNTSLVRVPSATQVSQMLTFTQVCFAYYDQAANTPGTLVNTTGIFKQNVDLLTGIMFKAASGTPGCDQQILPFGPAGV